MEIAAFAVSIVAAGISLAAAVYAKRAAAAAHRSARADERSAAAAEAAGRREDQRDRELAAKRQAEEAENRVKWQLRRTDHSGRTCRLHNTGTDTAQGVKVTLPPEFDDPQFSRNLPNNVAIQHRKTVEFDILVPQSRVDHVLVSWDGHPEPVRVDIKGPQIIV